MGKIKIGASGRGRLFVVDRNILHFYHEILDILVKDMSQNCFCRLKNLFKNRFGGKDKLY